MGLGRPPNMGRYGSGQAPENLLARHAQRCEASRVWVCCHLALFTPSNYLVGPCLAASLLSHDQGSQETNITISKPCLACQVAIVAWEWRAEPHERSQAIDGFAPVPKLAWQCDTVVASVAKHLLKSHRVSPTYNEACESGTQQRLQLLCCLAICSGPKPKHHTPTC